MKKNNKFVSISLATLMLALPLTGVYAESNTTNNKVETVVEVNKDNEFKKMSDEEIAEVFYDLVEAKAKLTSDYKNLLKEEIKRENFVRFSKDYQLASDEVKQGYNKALTDAKVLLNNEDSSREKLQTTLVDLRLNEAMMTRDYKITLKNEINFGKELMNSVIYKETDVEKSTNYDTALAVAQDILNDGKSSELEIQNAFVNLREARESLDNHVNFKEELKIEIQNEATVKESKEYSMAQLEYTHYYDEAIKEAKEILNRQDASSEDLSIALYNVKEAVKKLGFTDLQLMQVELNRAESIKESDEYKNATTDDRTNYDNAIDAAQFAIDESK